jgi:hypothetical protein
LQTEFARKQFEAVTEQGREFSGHLQKIVANSVEPIKAAVARRSAA